MLFEEVVKGFEEDWVINVEIEFGIHIDIVLDKGRVTRMMCFCLATLGSWPEA